MCIFYNQTEEKDFWKKNKKLLITILLNKVYMIGEIHLISLYLYPLQVLSVRLI